MAKTKTESTTKAVAKTAANPKKPAATKKATVATATKPATEPATKRPAKPRATANTRVAAKHGGNSVPEQQRAHYIEVAAFYIAERRGFAPANPVDDWLAAEAEIDQLLAEGRLG